LGRLIFGKVLEKAEQLFLKSLDIFHKNDHPEAYSALESLGDLYLEPVVMIKKIR